MFYKLKYVLIEDPRPLQCGVKLGERREIPITARFRFSSDEEARYFVKEHYSGCDARRVPLRTEYPKLLIEVDDKGKEIRVVKDYS